MSARYSRERVSPRPGATNTQLNKLEAINLTYGTTRCDFSHSKPSRPGPVTRCNFERPGTIWLYSPDYT